MKNAGIIAEYNPFHTGHLWQIAQLRRMGAETVTVALGGDFTQRGRPAAFSSATRARAALACGADLVVELPLPFCAASARQFAGGGVAVLAALGCVDTLCFGAECDRLDVLQPLAALLGTEAFARALQGQLATGLSWPAARAAAAETALPGSGAVLAGPNNILALAYLEAIAGQQAALCPLPLARQGAGHDAPAPDGGFASASFLRKVLEAGDAQVLRQYVPPAAMAVYERDLAAGAFVWEEAFSRSLLTVLRTLTPAQAARLPAAGGEGLANLLCTAAARAGSADELYAQMKSKRYTHARLRRLALEGYLSIPAGLPDTPRCLRVLGASERGLSLLAAAKQTATLPVVFSLAEEEKLPGCEALAALTARAGALYGLCLKTPTPAGAAYSQKFIRV